MAFKDISVNLYDGRIQIDYKDAAHRYYRRDVAADGTVGKARLISGVTTIMDNTLEKKSLMTWPMGMALKYLTGFYDFEGDNGRMTGFSPKEGGGALWGEDGKLKSLTKEEALPVFLEASKEWIYKRDKGANIGTVVHDAIEQFVLGNFKGMDPFVWIEDTYRASFLAKEGLTDEERARLDKDLAPDIACGIAAFDQFQSWWRAQAPELLGAEDLIYSEEMDYCGTFDGLLKINGKVVLADWKTTNASKKEAPQGVYYSYFLQLGAYAAAWQEMGRQKIDDLLIVSARKDGCFDTKSASELGVTVEQCIMAWKCLHALSSFNKQVKKQLIETATTPKEN